MTHVGKSPEPVPFDPFAGGRLQATGPTTEAQREILAAVRMAPTATLAYQEAVHVAFRGALDVDALELALRDLYRRHGALRSTFSSDDEAFFVWDRDLDFRRSEASPAMADEALAELLHGSVREPLDVLDGPLFRAVLLEAGPERFDLLLVAHHLVCDGWSYGVLIRELSEGYRARSARRAPVDDDGAPDFLTYATRERVREGSPEHTSTVGFWKRIFHGSIPSLELPSDSPRAGVRTFGADRVDVEIDGALVARLRSTAAACETSLFGLLLSAFYAVLGRLSGQSDIVVAVPAAGQLAVGMEGLVGHCVNVLPLRVVTDEADSVPLFARKVTSRLADAFQHQDFTVGRLLRTVNVPRDASRPPVTPVMFNLDRAVHRDLAGFDGPDVSVHGVPRVAEYFELFLNLFEHADGISAECQFNSDIFEEGTITEWVESYVTFLRGLADDPHRPVAEVPWVPARRLASLGGSVGLTRPLEGASLLSLVEAAARQTPDAPAVRWSGGQWSYRELLARAADLSHGLVAAGVERGDRVAVCLGDGGDLPAGLLAVMGSGAAYVPLDLGDPPDRLRRTLQDAGAVALLTDASGRLVAERLGEAVSIPVLGIQDLGGSGHTSFSRMVEDPAHDIAYVIYTSGSTGTPKGVQVPHRALANFLLATRNVLDVGADVAIPVITTLSFDISILEIFLPLVVGGTTLPLPRELTTDPRGLVRRLRESGATLVQATPSTWSMLVDSGWEGGEGFTALAGGEALSPELADRLLDRARVLWNMYGPTETTVWSACHRVERGDVPVPLGKPLANTVIHVLDGSGCPVPAGVPGEIFIGGTGVAAGYLNRPDLTTARFVPDPTGRESTPVYRTGDRGKWDADGRLHFLGRLDDQIKVRGHRVELGEIEAALESHPAVSMAAATLLVGGEAGDGRLVAWVEGPPAATETNRLEELRKHLARTLPAYMMPEQIAWVDRIPRSAAGKVDRNALPRDVLATRAPGESGSAPSTPEGRFVADVWAEVLGLDRVSLEDDFFALGGHSILAVRVVTRVDRHFDIDIGFRTLFEAPTLGAFVERIVERIAEANRPAGGEPWEDPTSTDLSLQQERLWYLDRVEGGLPAYNLSGAFQLDGPLDLGVLEGALAAFVARHELLRSVVREEAGRAELERLQGTGHTFEVRAMEDLVGAEGSEDDLRLWLEGEADRVIPLDRVPLIRFTLVRISETRHVLFLLVHHIVWDGRCFDIFLRDVQAMYEAGLHGRSPDLPPLEARFSDYVAWQKRQVTGPRLASATEFWDDTLGLDHPTLDLPIKGPRPPTMTYAGDRVAVRFDQGLLEGIRKLARDEHATVYVVLLAAFKALLFRYSRQEDLIVASPVEGRTLPQFEDVVGFFVNTLVVRSAPGPDLSFRTFLRHTRNAFLDSVDHQDTPFEWLVQRYARRDPSRTPLFQAMFTHQQTGSRPPNWGPVAVRSFVRGTRSAATDVGLWVREYDDYLDGGLDYRTDLFERDTAEGMVRAFEALVRAAVENPELTLGELPLMSSAEMDRETKGRAGPVHPSLPARSYLDAVLERVRDTPDGHAVREEDGAWTTWSVLWERSGEVARTLRRHAVQPGDVVGLMVERDARLVPLLIGIHRAGAVYLPLDPDFPDARLEYMVRDSGATIALVDERVTGGRSLDFTVDQRVGTIPADGTLTPGDSGEGGSQDVPCDDEGGVGPDDLAYLIYTSGSTGMPKAVAIEHGALANLLHSAGATLDVGADDTFVAVTTISFDISLLELLLPLCLGARLVVADGPTAQDPRALARLLEESEATVMQSTPATWLMLVDDGWRGRLRTILSGGETLPRPLADRLRERADRVWNLYGPTETTIWSTAERVSAGEGAVSIGRPLHNTRVYVLDASRRPVPVGMRGEIWIAGAGLARGYHDRPELTTEMFTADPFVPGERMYRTGDLGRWKSDGRLEHLGRIDFQVKVHGFRIELGEIETALERMDEVRQAVVEAKGTDGDRRLVAYVAFRPGRSLLAGDIRRRLARSLPAYMLPGLVVAIDEFPLTLNGKVDRAALPDPVASPTTRYIHEEPSTAMEETIAAVWQELLGVERVGRHDNFFELGGHSLLSIRATVQIEERTGERLDPRDFFFRSLAQLAAGA